MVTHSRDEVAIRVATGADVPGIRLALRSSILGIAVQDYPLEVLDNWGVDTAEARDKQARAIRDLRELTWVAIANDAIAGFSALDPRYGVVRAVYVAQYAARRGVGTRLLLEVESTARALGLPKLTLDSSLTAVPFYLHHGYRSLGERSHTLSTGVPMRAVAMEKDLQR